MEAELNERFLRGISLGTRFLRVDLDQSDLLVHVEFPEYLGCVQKILILKDPAIQISQTLNACQGRRSLLRIVCK